MLFIFSLIPWRFILTCSMLYLFLVLICVMWPCNVPWHVTAPYKLSFYYYYYYYYYYQRRGGVEQRHTITALGNPPTIWQFINGLRRYQKLKDTEIEGLLLAEMPPKDARPTNVWIGASKTSFWATRIVISVIFYVVWLTTSCTEFCHWHLNRRTVL